MKRTGLDLEQEWERTDRNYFYQNDHAVLFRHFEWDSFRIWENPKHESCSSFRYLSIEFWITSFGPVLRKLWSKYHRLPGSSSSCGPHSLGCGPQGVINWRLFKGTSALDGLRTFYSFILTPLRVGSDQRAEERPEKAVHHSSKRIWENSRVGVKIVSDRVLLRFFGIMNCFISLFSFFSCVMSE